MQEAWYYSPYRALGVDTLTDAHYAGISCNLICQPDCIYGTLSFMCTYAGDMAEPITFQPRRITEIGGVTVLHGERDEILATLFSWAFLMEKLWASTDPTALLCGIGLWIQNWTSKRPVRARRIINLDMQQLFNNKELVLQCSDSSMLVIAPTSQRKHQGKELPLPGLSITVSTSGKQFGGKNILTYPPKP